MRRLIKLLAYLWAAPWTMVGTSVGLLGLLTGGRAQRRGPILEFYGGGVTWLLNRLPIQPMAMTVGHSVLGVTAALSVMLRLFAPFLPFVTEEVWSWWRSGSVHQAAWPDPRELAGPASGADPLVLDVTAEVLGAVRRAKTTAKQSMRAPVAVLTVTDNQERIDALMQGVDDLKDAGGVAELVTVIGPESSIDVELDVQD